MCFVSTWLNLANWSWRRIQKWENKVYVKGQTEYRRHVIRNLESSLLGTLGSGELISLVPLPLLSPSSGTHRYLNI